MTLNQAITLLERKYPIEKAEEWDFNGLQLDSGTKEVKVIGICLDPSLINIKKAVADGVDLLIVHHPLFFGDKEELLSENPILREKRDIAYQSKMSIYSLHTPIDNASNGMGDKQMKILFSDVNDLKPHFRAHGIVSYSTIISSEDLLSRLSKIAIPELIMLSFKHETVFNKVVIAPGASGSLFATSSGLSVHDAIIVGEVKHNEWIEAVDRGFHVIEIGHWTENVFCELINGIFNDVHDHEKVEIKIYKPFTKHFIGN